MNHRLQIVSTIILAVTTGCASQANGVPVTANGTTQSAQVVRPNDYGNIRWNRNALHLNGGPATAVLTYWARDGYSLYPIQCKNGGKIVATPGTPRGNPQRYDHVRFTFVAKTKKPDTCGLTAVLDNTGSPPFAIIKLYIDS